MFSGTRASGWFPNPPRERRGPGTSDAYDVQDASRVSCGAFDSLAGAGLVDGDREPGIAFATGLQADARDGDDRSPARGSGYSARRVSLLPLTSATVNRLSATLTLSAHWVVPVAEPRTQRKSSGVHHRSEISTVRSTPSFMSIRRRQVPAARPLVPRL